MMPRLFTDGMLVTGDAAALVLGTGLILEGANLAIASGIAAGRDRRQGPEKGDFSQATLQHYENLLKEQFVLQDLHTFREAPEFLENERIYRPILRWPARWPGRFFRTTENPAPRRYQVLKEGMQGKVSLWDLFSDAWKARKAI